MQREVSRCTHMRIFLSSERITVFILCPCWKHMHSSTRLDEALQLQRTESFRPPTITGSSYSPARPNQFRHLLLAKWLRLITRRAERIDVVRLRKAVSVRTDPLAAALADDGDELGVTTVRPRRWSIFLWTQRGAGVLTVLARAELAARADFLAVLVRLAIDLARLGRLGYADTTIYLFI